MKKDYDPFPDYGCDYLPEETCDSFPEDRCDPFPEYGSDPVFDDTVQLFPDYSRDESWPDDQPLAEVWQVSSVRKNPSKWEGVQLYTRKKTSAKKTKKRAA